jgi:hypothetical protein
VADDSTQLALASRIDDVRARARRFVRGYIFRSMTESDGAELADLYFHTYGRDVVASKDDADAELARTFAGEYGRLNLGPRRQSLETGSS